MTHLLTFFWLCLCSWTAQAADGVWEVLGTTDGIEVSRMTMADSNLFAFRGEADVDVHISLLSSLLLDDTLGPQWVDLMVLSTLLEQASPTRKIIHQGYGLPWPISDRDYVLQQDAGYDNATKVFTLDFKSVSHASRPVQDDYVRAIAFRTFWNLTAKGDQTHAIVEVYTDPKGALPAWLVNLIQKDWPYNTITGLTARASKGDLTADPNNADW
jgi:hypothetical protein